MLAVVAFITIDNHGAQGLCIDVIDPLLLQAPCALRGPSQHWRWQRIITATALHGVPSSTPTTRVVSFIQLGLSLSIESSSVSWLRYMFALHSVGQHLASATDHGGTLACEECQSDCWHVVHLLQFWTWASRPEVQTVAQGIATSGKHSMQSRSR